MHKRLVSGIAFSREEAIITLCGIPSESGIEGRILSKVSEANIEIDMIAQNASSDLTSDFTFTVQRREHGKAMKLMEEVISDFNTVAIKTNSKVAKLSLVGIGMRSHTGVASTMFNALGRENIKIQMITTSEIKISVVIDESQLDVGVRAVHQAFDLDKPHLPQEPSFIE